MKSSFTLKFIANFLIFSAASVSFAHISLDQGTATAGTTYKAVLRVGHGCEGLPTQRIRVSLPAGFEGAKPMPKAGWVISSKTEKLATPYTSHGKTIEQDVSEITWSAATPEQRLPDSQFDEFVLRGRLGMPAGAVWFKIEQLCDDGKTQGRTDWSEVPASGTNTQGMKAPAALLQVQPAPVNTVAPAAPAQRAHGTEHKH